MDFEPQSHINHCDTLRRISLNYCTPQQPFIHYMGIISLFFEASTPFLHIRQGLIQSGNGSGLLFQMTQMLFAVLFFLVRIVFGYYECGRWSE